MKRPCVQDTNDHEILQSFHHRGSDLYQKTFCSILRNGEIFR